MVIDLDPRWQAFVRQKVASGQYDSERQVLEAALGRLEQSENWSGPSGEELRKLVQEGVDAADRGELVDGKEAFRKIFDELEARRNTGK